MPVTRKRLIGPAQVPLASGTAYTVPANTKAVLRHIHIYNPGPAAATITMSIGADAAATRIFDGKSIAVDESFDHFCYYVLAETEIIDRNSDTNNQLVLTVNGEEITL